MKAIINIEGEKDNKYFFYKLQDREFVIHKEACEIIEEQKEEPFLTEKQFEKIFRICSFPEYDKDNYNKSFKMAEKIIKKSKKQDFEDYYGNHNRWKHDVNILYQKAMAAIEEAENK